MPGAGHDRVASETGRGLLLSVVHDAVHGWRAVALDTVGRLGLLGLVETPTEASADAALDRLYSALSHYQGPTAPVLLAWMRTEAARPHSASTATDPKEVPHAVPNP